MKATIIIKEKADIRLDIKSVGRGSTVRIQSSANFYMELVYNVNWNEKTNIEKIGREWRIKKLIKIIK